MQEDCPDRPADERKLFVAVRCTIIDIKLMRDAISRYRFPKKLLEVGSIILIKEFSPTIIRE